ncbi:MAG TPA: hypothetical protein VLF19_04550 [Methylomirabilota bacterium]|nr:hypothetical protein [Methylomirabilota bacterium]
MDPGPAPRPRTPLDDAVVRALGSVAATLAPLLAGAPDLDHLLQTRHHGTLVAYAEVDGARRRVLELDRGGTPLAVLRWAERALDAAWLKIPDGRWVAIEPRASSTAPWGAADRLRTASEPGALGDPLTLFEALDYTAVDRVPTLAEPGRVPPGAGVVVLNLLASLTTDERRERLAYHGPYPGEQLFLALLESFRYEPAVADPLAAFVAGALSWRPDPHERWFTSDGVYVQWRGRVEKVVWRDRAYRRPDWQGVARHAPLRVRDADGAVRCSLWALGGPLEDHLELSPAGTVVRVWAPSPQAVPPRALPAVAAAGVGAVVAATSAPALAAFVRQEAAALRLTWAHLSGGLVEIEGAEVRLSTRLGERFADRTRAAADEAVRATLGLAALAEIAGLVGDTLRARAQARAAALPAADQEALLAAPPAAAGAGDARAITAAVGALLDDAAARSASG